MAHRSTWKYPIPMSNHHERSEGFGTVIQMCLCINLLPLSLAPFPSGNGDQLQHLIVADCSSELLSKIIMYLHSCSLIESIQCHCGHCTYFLCQHILIKPFFLLIHTWIFYVLTQNLLWHVNTCKCVQCWLGWLKLLFIVTVAFSKT